MEQTSFQFLGINSICKNINNNQRMDYISIHNDLLPNNS